MYKKVLALTHKEDRHADAVIEELERRGVSYLRINTEDITTNYLLNFDLGSSLFTLSI